MTSTDVDTPALPPVSDEQWFFHEDGLLTEPQALQVTAKIRGYAAQLYRHVMRAHERRIWLALGYETWAEYCEKALQVSRSRGYQLVDWGLVERALTSGTPDGAPPPVDLSQGIGLITRKPALSSITEAQARPLAPFKGDQRAVRLIWGRAAEIAGPNAVPTQAQVQQAVDEWKAPAADELWRSEERLVTAEEPWTGGPVWWTWQTPSDGVKLYLGLGEMPGALTMQERALFTSEARYGDMAAVAADDLDKLVPRLIAELFANQVPSADEVHEVGRLVDDLGIEWGKRGPFTFGHEQVAGAFAELAHIYDDDWSDTSSHEPVDDDPPPAAVDPDDEVVDAEIIEDEPAVAAPDAAVGRRHQLLERLRALDAELAGDVPSTRRLRLIQDRLSLEAELDGRPAPRPAPPASRQPAAAPPTTTSPASVGAEEVGDDGPGLPSSSTTPVVAGRERALIEDEDELHGWCREYVTRGLAGSDSMLVRDSAGFFRALASRFEDRAAALERKGAAA